jgi:hypothetical protein
MNGGAVCLIYHWWPTVPLNADGEILNHPDHLRREIPYRLSRPLLCLPLVRFKDRDAQLDLQNAIADAIDAGCPVPLKRRNGHRNTLHLAQNEWGSEIKYD